MRLLRCHIENFGVLSGFDYEFPEGLAVICRESGFGKSTLAAFLKAMFYGLPRTGAHNVTENERRRFEPWQGGKFGGFLEFEYQGAAYRVTRYFGKTAAADAASRASSSAARIRRGACGVGENRQRRTRRRGKLNAQLSPPVTGRTRAIGENKNRITDGKGE